jgi:hypothetical protein
MFKLIGFVLLAGIASAQTRLYISPMEGSLDGFIAAEIIKQHIPVKVVISESDADLILVGKSIKADDKWYQVAFRTAKDKNEGNLRMIDPRTKTMVWAGEAGDRSLMYNMYRRGGQRKVAERLVKRMKDEYFRNAVLERTPTASGYHLAKP